jgi:hypothetical protein
MAIFRYYFRLFHPDGTAKQDSTKHLILQGIALMSNSTAFGGNNWDLSKSLFL